MIDKLLEKIQNNCHNIDIDMVKKAYNFAEEAHKEQKRESGEPYIIHPIAVAEILAEMGMDTNTIVAGLLHDVIEDTHYSYEETAELFNPQIANLVDGVTKLTKLGEMEYKTKEEQQADNVRKMLLAMAKDIRVIIIKLADRLHNMRTLKFMPANKQKNKAKETLDIYAPLAHRLGISKIKWELEDLCFRYLHEKEYYELVDDIAEKRVERETYIKDVVKDLNEKLESAGIDSDIDGRPKHFYSIYKKMVTKNKSIEQIFDLTAIRVLVNSVKDCYGVLGIVHTIYRPIPGRFKDYIAMPKPNMYQSLHTTVIGPQGKTFEIQIRTFEMHKTAEYGIAAHWKYKEGDTGKNEQDKEMDFEKKLVWLRDMLEWQKETSDAEEFIEGFKIDLFSDEVFVFTPKGVVINLCRDATPIDFAYRIHTDVGNKCVGAKVNGRIVPLDYTLKTGEIVEILTSSNAKGPNMDWLNIAKSNQSKSKIKLWFKKAKKEENILKGKELLEKELKKQGVNYADIAKGDTYEKTVKRYNIHTIDDLHALFGIGGLSVSTFISRLKEDNGIDKVNKEKENKEILNKSIEEQIAKSARQPEPNSYGITVKGESNLMVRFAKCCSPVPGDEILGYITKGRGVSVHRKDCTNLQNLIDTDGDRVVEVNWGSSKGNAYFAEIQVEADDRDGLLADIMSVITDLKLQLSAVNANLAKKGSAFVNVKVKITSVDTLTDLMKRIRKLKGVVDVYRVNS
ncbi:RelA/SpoT family protein [Clostridium saccharobutylicum]|uniref:GTP diphosphokinase n=1 Tax=Clostridium saccharobutylicum DSM 13864 TaxID=1345695 RepID=U5MWJ8_CLOSA|nr:bifunctional (p)ppGpp synthetase/guanosine-3',5'-bis(diphosphate) 3'-pyrophosphohydrolase [Clostridium saccharobutylicum]AGX43837.1 GTP pyrophosphokinase RelA [Clostridium saccharobutylicum DSM 13864]AQR91137.1 GTP pyrophosphokinase [Clostridium saccharobutylicum]AQS01041.1 GTP pyrophosphokinase [Clostridium saccharobutylicum]AQS10777.1 GTP pyrophosphokinase [Clostridium saccharobutylicum]AQS15024.1 GTP pyrophosphokinase [Clostridium saccharobutylicum]